MSARFIGRDSPPAAPPPRLDAYQRMFSEHIDEDLVRRRVESAQIMNQQTGNRFDDQAMANNAELLMMLILMESQVY